MRVTKGVLARPMLTIFATLAFGGTLAVCIGDAGNASTLKSKRCISRFESVENGLCVNNSYINTERPNPCVNALCYRSSHKHRKHHLPNS